MTALAWAALLLGLACVPVLDPDSRRYIRARGRARRVKRLREPAEVDPDTESQSEAIRVGISNCEANINLHIKRGHLNLIPGQTRTMRRLRRRLRKLPRSEGYRPSLTPRLPPPPSPSAEILRRAGMSIPEFAPPSPEPDSLRH